MTYRTLVDFYRGHPLRARSRERQLGGFWRSGRGRAGRAAWLEETGELVLIQHGLSSASEAGAVEVLGVVRSEGELDRLVGGWERVCGKPGSLEWLTGQLAVGSGGRVSPDLPEAG